MLYIRKKRKYNSTISKSNQRRFRTVRQESATSAERRVILQNNASMKLFATNATKLGTFLNSAVKLSSPLQAIRKQQISLRIYPKKQVLFTKASALRIFL